MSAQGAYAFVSPVASSDVTLPIAYRDPLLSGALNSGVRFDFDLAFGFSYPGGPYAGRPAAAAPTNLQNVYDVAEVANGSALVNAAGSLSYAGGGFDLTASSGKNNGVQAPASVSADLWTAFGGNSQQLILCGYFKLPTFANWPTGTGIIDLMSAGQYNTTAALVSVCMTADGAGNMEVRRQTAAGVAENILSGVHLSSGNYGALAQVAWWRNASGQGLRIKTVAQTVIATTATVGAQNTDNFSALPAIWGRGNGFDPGGVSAIYTGARIYRGFIENLARSGRDPVTVLDADWARVVARNSFT